MTRVGVPRVWQYGHTMMWWDRIAGTYKYPHEVRTFNKSLATKVQGGSWYQTAEAPELQVHAERKEKDG